MRFLTEEDIKTRCSAPGSMLRLAADERLTPSASEYASRFRIEIVQHCGTCAVEQTAKAEVSLDVRRPSVTTATACVPMTHLDAGSVVPKSHPRVEFRGKLDSLLATAILVRTQFDARNCIAPYLKECLDDVTTWIMCILTSDVSGEACIIKGMGGMDMDTVHTVSRDPDTYLGITPFVPDGSLGGNAALVNWLRALAREAEVAGAKCALGREDVASALNRLSSALYVLLLLTVGVERGMELKGPGIKND